MVLDGLTYQTVIITSYYLCESPREHNMGFKDEDAYLDAH